jgi:alanine dehydrogenase
MIIGCPTEIKVRESRVGLVPASCHELTRAGHDVLIQKDAGLGAGISNDEYREAGASLVESATDVWERSDMVIKVKEPLPDEFDLMQDGQTLFTYLHLAPMPDLTRALVAKNVSGVAYETIQVGNHLPLLKPMSEVAGKMATQVGAMCLEKRHGGKGVLLGGVPGVPRGRVVIIGGGVVGLNAAKIAVGMGAEVTILDINLDRLEYLDDIFLGRAQTLYSTPHNVATQVAKADLVVGAILLTGARAPRLVTKEHVGAMEEGSVIVDVAVDQGGCVETSQVTTHDEPTITIDGVVHYGVANMPGAVSRTSTYSLAHATLPYALKLANQGVENAVRTDPSLALGMNTYQGQVTYEAVAKAHGLEYTPLERLLA